MVIQHQRVTVVMSSVLGVSVSKTCRQVSLDNLYVVYDYSLEIDHDLATYVGH